MDDEQRERRKRYDQQVGRRLRAARSRRGLSQAMLADRLGVSFQQLQKYETTKNRITVGMLAAAELGVPVVELLPGPSQPAFPAVDRSTAEVIELWNGLEPGLRKSLLGLLRRLPKGDDQ